MKIETFRMLADTYGGDLSRWPSAHQSAAAALLRSDPRAAAVLDDALVVDHWLNAATVTVDDDRVDRLADAISHRIDQSAWNAASGKNPAGKSRWPLDRSSGLRPGWTAGFLLAMGLLGVMTGMAVPTTTDATSLTATVGSEQETASLTMLTDATAYYSARYFVNGGR